MGLPRTFFNSSNTSVPKMLNSRQSIAASLAMRLMRCSSLVERFAESLFHPGSDIRELEEYTDDISEADEVGIVWDR